MTSENVFSSSGTNALTAMRRIRAAVPLYRVITTLLVRNAKNAGRISEVSHAKLGNALDYCSSAFPIIILMFALTGKATPSARTRKMGWNESFLFTFWLREKHVERLD